MARGLVPRWGRGGAWQNPSCRFAVPNHNSGFSYLGVPAPAGMSDCYESMSRTTIRDRPLRQPLIRHSRHPFVNPAPIRHSGEGRNPEGWGEGIVALGLVPSSGRTARSRKLHGPAYHHFHPLMRPSHGHGDSGEKPAPYPDTGPESRGVAGEAPITPKHSRRPVPILITWCAGSHRHARFLLYSNEGNLLCPMWLYWI